MKLVGLSRQIVLSMMTMAFGVTLLFLLTSYAFYFLLLVYWPEKLSEDSWIPSGAELGWIVGTTIAGLIFSVVVAIGLSRRILLPLNSVADGIRRVAKGELDVRAEAGDRSLGEVALLADDFNALADKLQRMTEEQVFWNAAIAHELRTPVTILRGRLQGLADGVFTPDTAQFLSLLRQVEGLSRLIEDLRVVGLVESGHLALQWQETDLAAEVRSVADFCASGLQAAGQRLQLELDPQRVYCDPVRMRQALLALLENVRQYALPGVVRIQTSVESGQCCLRVEDDGPGIPAEAAAQVFQAFRRADATRSNATGSGLGLAVVAAIALVHGGKVSCQPTSAGGTRFTLVWPNVVQPQPVALAGGVAQTSALAS